MIDQCDDRREPTARYGFFPSEWEGQSSLALPAESDRASVAPFTPYERILIWCVLTLLSAHNLPSPRRSPPPGSHLTAREIEVLGLVALGLTNAQIAARLFLSRRTIDQHLSSIYNRLGVSSRAAATRFAMLHGLY
jgi:DNA-binding NarL/FixJ family response regulator